MSTLTLPLEQNGEKRCGTQESDPRTEKNDPTYFLVSVQGFLACNVFSHCNT